MSMAAANQSRFRTDNSEGGEIGARALFDRDMINVNNEAGGLTKAISPTHEASFSPKSSCTPAENLASPTPTPPLPKISPHPKQSCPVSGVVSPIFVTPRSSRSGTDLTRETTLPSLPPSPTLMPADTISEGKRHSVNDTIIKAVGDAVDECTTSPNDDSKAALTTAPSFSNAFSSLLLFSQENHREEQEPGRDKEQGLADNLNLLARKEEKELPATPKSSILPPLSPPSTPPQPTLTPHTASTESKPATPKTEVLVFHGDEQFGFTRRDARRRFLGDLDSNGTKSGSDHEDGAGTANDLELVIESVDESRLTIISGTKKLQFLDVFHSGNWVLLDEILGYLGPAFFRILSRVCKDTNCLLYEGVEWTGVVGHGGNVLDFPPPSLNVPRPPSIPERFVDSFVQRGLLVAYDSNTMVVELETKMLEPGLSWLWLDAATYLDEVTAFDGENHYWRGNHSRGEFDQSVSAHQHAFRTIAGVVRTQNFDRASSMHLACPSRSVSAPAHETSDPESFMDSPKSEVGALARAEPSFAYLLGSWLEVLSLAQKIGSSGAEDSPASARAKSSPMNKDAQISAGGTTSLKQLLFGEEWERVLEFGRQMFLPGWTPRISSEKRESLGRESGGESPLGGESLGWETSKETAVRSKTGGKETAVRARTRKGFMGEEIRRGSFYFRAGTASPSRESTGFSVGELSAANSAASAVTSRLDDVPPSPEPTDGVLLAPVNQARRGTRGAGGLLRSGTRTGVNGSNLTYVNRRGLKSRGLNNEASLSIHRKGICEAALLGDIGTVYRLCFGTSSGASSSSNPGVFSSGRNALQRSAGPSRNHLPLTLPELIKALRYAVGNRLYLKASAGVVLLLLGGTPEQLRKSRDGSEIIREIGTKNLLHEACHIGNVYIVRIFLEYRVSLKNNSEGIAGATPLHHAASNGHADIIELLVKFSAQVNARSRAVDGNTALHSALKTGRVDVVKQLLSLGACPLLKTQTGKAPMQVLVETSRVRAFRYTLCTKMVRPRSGPPSRDASTAASREPSVAPDDSPDGESGASSSAARRTADVASSSAGASSRVSSSSKSFRQELECRETVEEDELAEILEGYVANHRFCWSCAPLVYTNGLSPFFSAFKNVVKGKL